jgi:hypothetical protein
MVRVIDLTLLPRTVQLQANLMLLALNLCELIFEHTFPLLRHPCALEVCEERVCRCSIVQVAKQTVHIAASNAEVFHLRLKDGKVVACTERCRGLRKCFLRA